jgi:hypothetical protein
MIRGGSAFPNNWDSVMEELSTEDTKVILRDLNLNKIGID